MDDNKLAEILGPRYAWAKETEPIKILVRHFENQNKARVCEPLKVETSRQAYVLISRLQNGGNEVYIDLAGAPFLQLKALNVKFKLVVQQ